MKNKTSEILTEVASYYSQKLAIHGQTPKGVDWNGEDSQYLRFEQLCKIINTDPFSVNDLGCGYGALLDYLSKNQTKFSYLGIDVADEMIETALKNGRSKENVRFIVASEPDQVADYGIASGIFNVRLERSDEEWFAYLRESLDLLDRTSRFGFAFNCLTSYSDAEKKKDSLYYADPGVLFDLCKKNYSKNIALLHDYGLYEFTVLVRKNL